MPEKIPKGWVETKLREVCLQVASLQPGDSPDIEFTYFDIGGIDNVGNRIAETKTVTGRNAPSRARQAVHKDDILFSTVRTYLRKIARVERDYPNPVASTGFTVIRAAEGVSSQFLYYQVLSEDFLQPLHKLQTGTSYPAVRDRDVLSQPILLPPTGEQARIVAKLNAALSSVERAETAARRAHGRLQRYRAAVLLAAFSGELTSKWRDSQGKKEQLTPETSDELLQKLLAVRRARWEEAELERFRISSTPPTDDKWKSRYPEPVPPDTIKLDKLPNGWTWASLDQLCIVVRGASPRPAGDPRYFGGTIPWITVGSLTKDLQPYLTETSETVTKAGKEASRYIEPETLLLTNSGATLGVPKISRIAGCINDGVAALLFVDYPLKLYLYYFLISQTESLRNINQGAAQPNLNTMIIRRIVTPIPPLKEQAEIIREVEHRLLAANRLSDALAQQLSRAHTTRQELLRDAFAGRLVPQNPHDEPASILLEHILIEKAQRAIEQKQSRQRQTKKRRSDAMQNQAPLPESLIVAWNKIGKKAEARRLFDEAGFGPNDVAQFYEALRATPEVRVAFQEAAQRYIQPQKPTKPAKEKHTEQKGNFRLTELWLEEFKNLRKYMVRFDPAYALDVVLGWNGTGKSNLFEALVIIFRDLHEWQEKNRWPDKSMNGYRLCYEIDEHTMEVTWQPGVMRRPELKRGSITRKANSKTKHELIKREQLQLPRFVFGYYSGPTNRLAEHFLPMKQAHYVRLREAKADDAQTLATLLEQRRFFCAETHHAKYVLLAFSYKEDPKISEFLKDRLRILSFESALFVIRKPRWAKPGSKSEDFWGATGIMRRVMERLRRYAIASMVLEQTVNYGYRSTTEDHYYFFLPDIESLHSFAAEYQDARSFFLALESTDFSELIHDVKIQVRIKATNTEQIPITFHQLSEGEQQLLMVLGLLRFTKSHQSLVLLDEPDTHLNPHWSVDYIKDLKRVMSDNAQGSPEQQSSQILMATHDPLVIASLVKEQIHLLKRDVESLRCYWEQPTENPRGLGFTGILTSDMFGFRSDLDDETLELLDKQVNLAGKKKLNREEVIKLENITQQVENLGFKSASSDPYYRAFIKAVVSRQRVHNLLLKNDLTKSDLETLQRETNEILQEIEAEKVKAR